MYGILIDRASIDLNQAAFNGKLGCAFNAVASKEQAYQHYAAAEDTRGHLALKHDLNSKRSSAPNTRRARPSASPPTTRKSATTSCGGSMRAGWSSVSRRRTTPGRHAEQRHHSQSEPQPRGRRPRQLTNFDARGQGISQADTAGLITDPRVSDSVNYRASLGGPSQSQESRFDTYSISIDRRFWKNTYLQLAYNHQNYNFEAWQASNPTGMKGDPNQFLRDGVTPNPNAGRLYFETYWTQRNRNEDSDNFRFTASQELNFGNGAIIAWPAWPSGKCAHSIIRHERGMD